MAKASEVEQKSGNGKEAHAKEGALAAVESGWQSLDTLRREVDRLFQNFMVGWPWGQSAFDVSPWTHLSATFGRGVPPADVVEKDKAFEIALELPGMSEEDIEVTVSDDMLTIRGQKSEEREEEKEKYRVSERRYGEFERSFRLPDSVDAEKIQAACKKGVLYVTLPKTAAAKKKARKIAVAGK